MKKINYTEFQSRLSEVAKARKIFIKSGITKNITDAFQLYQDILAEEQREVIITKLQTPIENMERPQCDECDSDLKLSTRPQSIDGKIYHTTWICEKCGMEYYSEKTVEEWYDILRKDKDEDQG